MTVIMKKTKKIILGLFATLMLIGGLTGTPIWANEVEVDFTPINVYIDFEEISEYVLITPFCFPGLAGVTGVIPVSTQDGRGWGGSMFSSGAGTYNLMPGSSFSIINGNVVNNRIQISLQPADSRVGATPWVAASHFGC